MENTPFFNIPERYELLKYSIQDTNIDEIYSNIDFLLFPFNLIQKSESLGFEKQNAAERYLFEYFSKFKFITFNFYNEIDIKINQEPFKNENNLVIDYNSETQISNAVFCVEKKCIIIKRVYVKFIRNIIEKLEEKQIFIINTNQNITNLNKSNEKLQLDIEINSFCEYFFNEKTTNEFVNYTITSIAGYLIHRYFYPTFFFNDPSFFDFGATEKIETQCFNDMMKCIEKDNKDNKINIHYFDEDEFIKLRTICSNEKKQFHLVFHIKSCYIFFLKKINDKTDKKAKQNEIDFCSHYSHRCITKFYGFLRKGEEITGFIYEFMSNGQLNSFVLSNKKRISQQYIFMVIQRIFKGIKYLHSNNLIHRDLNPSNIFIDHNFLPYISDFETIRSPIQKVRNSSDETYTSDIGTILYSSPEQDYGGDISYPTDIYSFGLIIYFLFEKKDMRSHNNSLLYSKKESDKILPIKNASDNLNGLYESCLNFSPNKRPLLDVIKVTLSQEYKMLDNLLNINLNEMLDFPLMYECLLYINKEYNGKIEDNFTMNDIHENIKLHFTEIPKQDILACFLDQSKKIRTIYSKLQFFKANFHILQYECQILKDYCEKYILGILKDFKFITYQISSDNDEIPGLNSIVSAFICVEDMLFIMEDIPFSFINQIVEKMIEHASIINVDYADNNVIKEISNFCSRFNFDIQRNLFVRKTIKSIACFLIRRFFYPTKYFKNKTFFYLNESWKFKEDEYRAKIIDFIESDIPKSPEFFLKLKCDLKASSKSQPQTFQLKDFIKLREIHHSNFALFNLAFHIDKQYLFCLKIPYNEISDNEIQFCKSYSHRCFTHFYGFLENKNNRIGFVYEFLCNDTLASFISPKKTITDQYTLMTINRIFQAIEYLHSNNLVYRDLKPSNILLDNNFIPYISDFETIKAKDFLSTKDFASDIYASPELFETGNVSFTTDIYSFGMTIFYIIEKKHKKTENDKITHFSNIFQDLFQNCINKSPSIRPNREKIKSCIINELYLNSISFLNKFEPVSETNITQLKNQDFILFIFEFLNIIRFKGEELSVFYNYLTKINQLLNKLKITKCTAEKSPSSEFYSSELFLKPNNSEIFYILGLLHQQAICPNIFKSKMYYEFAAKNKHQDALCKLGDICLYGESIQIDYSEAKKYYEIASQNKNAYAIYKLGEIYEKGLSVPINYLKAIEYYETAAQYKNSDALYKLGDIYLQGDFVETNKSKAIKYFELAAGYNNLNALCKLGILYYSDYNKDYTKARKYFELVSNSYFTFENLGFIFEPQSSHFIYTKNYNYEDKIYINNKSYALCYLGEIYHYGHGVNFDYSKAKYYYELSAQFHNNIALYNLGIIYEVGLDVKIDIFKAKEYYFQAIRYGNKKAYEKLGFLFEANPSLISNDFDTNNNNETIDQNIQSQALFELGKYYTYIDSSKSKKYIELAAKFNNPDALESMGDIYYELKDYNKAIKYYELAAQKGNIISIYKLGCIYEKGKYVEKNIEKAFEYYSIVAQSGIEDFYLYLGLHYDEGKVVRQNYKKAREYYELAKNISEAYICLGILYKKGRGVIKDNDLALAYFKQGAELDLSSLISYGYIFEIGYFGIVNYEKAAINYEIAIEHQLVEGYYFLANLLVRGLGVTNDYFKAKKYFEIAIENDFVLGYNCLGSLFYFGYGVEKNYEKAIEFYTKGANLGDLLAVNNLGFIYENGYGVEKDYIKAKNYYEISGYGGFDIGFLYLGNLYRKGLGFKQDIYKAIHFYEKISKSSSEAAFYLAYFYSSGEFFEVNENIAKFYYQKCIKILKKRVERQTIDYFNTLGFCYKGFNFRSYNNLGLFCILNENIDLKDAEKYFIEAGSIGYAFGQNNLGLLYEIYFEDITKAKTHYEKAAMEKFALSEFNIGNLEEKEKSELTTKAVEYYIKASNDEDEPLIFFQFEHHDKRLEVSKYFIICFTNLKLVKYFCSKLNLEEAKEYFIRSFNKIKSNQFHFQFNKECEQNIFIYLKYYILLHPLFNLKNQPNIKDIFDIDKLYQDFKKFRNNNEKTKKDLKFHLEQSNYHNKIPCSDNLFFDDPKILFDFVSQNRHLLEQFQKEIEDIHDIMKKILYQPPYHILFGRLNIAKPAVKKSLLKDINKMFYDGLGKI